MELIFMILDQKLKKLIPSHFIYQIHTPVKRLHSFNINLNEFSKTSTFRRK